MLPWHEEASVIATASQQAAGDIEFQTDATKVNTTAGWRDLKIAAFRKRPCGKPALPEAWTQRRLPTPTARV